MTGQGFNRRQILGAGAAGAGVIGASVIGAGAIGFAPGIAAAASLGTEGRSTSVIAEAAAPESRRFAAAFVGADLLSVGSTMIELLGEFAADAQVVIGLTSDPVAMIAGQRLVERGGRRLFQWNHRFEDGGWLHQLDGPADGLAGSGAKWPVALASIVAGRLTTSSAELRSCASGECLLARRSPGLLVSFAFDMTRGA